MGYLGVEWGNVLVGTTCLCPTWNSCSYDFPGVFTSFLHPPFLQHKPVTAMSVTSRLLTGTSFLFVQTDGFLLSSLAFYFTLGQSCGVSFGWFLFGFL